MKTLHFVLEVGGSSREMIHNVTKVIISDPQIVLLVYPYLFFAATPPPPVQVDGRHG